MNEILAGLLLLVIIFSVLVFWSAVFVVIIKGAEYMWERWLCRECRS